MSLPRFYLPSQEWSAAQPQLSAADTHHCAHVLRRVVGDEVMIFDGVGNEAIVVLTGFQKSKELQATIAIHARAITPRPRCQITLAQAVPKAKNMDLIIQKAVELRASRIVPLLTERTILRCENERDALQKQERWQQIAIEACKQSGQNWLPHVDKPRALQDFFGTLVPQQLLLLASLQSDHRSLKEILKTYDASLPTAVTIMIGPEGDFTPAESAVAKSFGFQSLHLGPIILRTETAAIYSLSVLAHELLSSCGG